MPFVPSGIPSVERTIPDHRGAPHTYDIEIMAFDESFNLGLELADLVGGPIGEAIKAMLTGADLDTDLANPSPIDIGKAVGGLFTLPQKILAAGGSKLAERILAGATRIAKDASGNPTKQRLGDPAARTAAYAGGNQAECFLAMRAVIEVNYGPFLSRIYEIVSPYLSGLGAMFVSQPRSGTTPIENGNNASDPPMSAETG